MPIAVRKSRSKKWRWDLVNVATGKVVGHSNKSRKSAGFAASQRNKDMSQAEKKKLAAWRRRHR